MPVPPPVIRTGRPSNVVMRGLRVVQLGAVVREHVLGERRDGRRGLAQRIAEALGCARRRDPVEHVPDGARERLGRVERLAAEAGRELRAALLQLLGAGAERARGVAELVDVARARDAQAVVVDGRRERSLARRLERGAQLGALVAGTSASARSTASAISAASGTSAASSAVSQSAASIAASCTRRESASASPSPSTAIQPSSGTSSASSSSSSAGGPSAHRNTSPCSNGSATSTPTTASPAAANGFAAAAAASS